MDLAVDVKYIAHVRSFSNPRDRCRVSQKAKILSNVNHQSSAFTNKTKKKSLIENNTCCDVRNRLFFFFFTVIQYRYQPICAVVEFTYYS